MTHATTTTRQVCSPGELAKQYGISVKILRSWLKAHRETIGERAGKYFNIRQMQSIYQCFGNPLSITPETKSS